MDITLTEEQQTLKKAAREFLQKECPKSLVRQLEQDERGFSTELWHRMAGMGWLGMLFPESYGGSALWKSNLLNAAILVEEFGYAALPSPFLSTVAQSGLLILELGSEEQKRGFLPRIARGELIMALALTEPNARFDAAGVTIPATPEEGRYVISGTKLFVSDAHIADYLICVTRTRNSATPEEGITLFLVEPKSPGVKCTPLRTVADRQCEVVFENVAVTQQSLLGDLHRGWEPLGKVMQKATTLKCAEMVGGAQAALDMTVEYAKRRVQFGKPIGSFQAVHHHLADMYRDIEVSRVLTYLAAWRLSEGLPAPKEVSLAKAKLSVAYPAITRMAHQIHGGVAFYTDYPLEIYYRKAAAAQVMFGDADHHRELIAQQLNL